MTRQDKASFEGDLLALISQNFFSKLLRRSDSQTRANVKRIAAGDLRELDVSKKRGGASFAFFRTAPATAFP